MKGRLAVMTKFSADQATQMMFGSNWALSTPAA